jgi:hypothetical protein
MHDKLVHDSPAGPKPYLESLRDKVVHDELIHGSPGHWHPGQLFHPVLSKILLFPGLKYTQEIVYSTQNFRKLRKITVQKFGSL